MYELKKKELLKMRDRLIFLKSIPFTIGFILFYQMLIYMFYTFIVGVPDVDYFSVLRANESWNVFAQPLIDSGSFINFVLIDIFLSFLFVPMIIMFYTDLKYFVYTRSKLQESKSEILWITLIVFPLLISFALLDANPDIESVLLLAKYNFISGLFYCFVFYQFLRISIKPILNFRLFVDYIRNPKKYDKIPKILYKMELVKTKNYREKCKIEKQLKSNLEKEINQKITIENF